MKHTRLGVGNRNLDIFTGITFRMRTARSRQRPDTRAWESPGVPPGVRRGGRYAGGRQPGRAAGVEPDLEPVGFRKGRRYSYTLAWDGTPEAGRK